MKVAIIGAGTCGLYLGRKLAQKGEDVTIFEKNSTTGNKICSGLFSERILDFIPESRQLIENEISSVIIHFPKKETKVNFSKKFLVINHSKLDNLLAGLAYAAGAKIILNQNISKLPEGFDKIIGCDGAYSFVRKELHLPDPLLRLGIQGFVRDNSNNNFVEAWPCKNGFLWKISRRGQTEYGIIADINRAYKTFNKFLEENKIHLKDIKAKAVPQGLIIPRNEKITLCGDAAGLTKPWSGGGVIWGLTAADILLKYYPDFKTYSKKARRFFSLKVFTSKIFIKAVYFSGFHLPFFLPKNNKVESDFLR
ncbi:FAD-dependent monooxygenase [Patescibacteria group bacterium]|nr:FAD-dependent monooxygenase [Patescibacteria group bacterium]MBU4367854.1 FAD-dependent monooxygenase [Patescibacteria group bacterium]MBU4461691.1 FAD-dependent monooxygenase [Patescibacteria group bacterium]MCG2700312.1 FAD-dependent monooxygenase [Candidatus Parcubacteria bacterium]